MMRARFQAEFFQPFVQDPDNPEEPQRWRHQCLSQGLGTWAYFWNHIII